jgi:hypothetical protein
MLMYRFEEMTTRPFGAKGEALAQLAASPVLKELHGHPKVRRRPRRRIDRTSHVALRES